jgi:hypothetical protein
MSDDVKVKTTVPAGCEPAPGWILEAAEGGPWFKLDGTITAVWAERGVWPSISEAGIALHHFLQRQPSLRSLGESPETKGGHPPETEGDKGYPRRKSTEGTHTHGAQE